MNNNITENYCSFEVSKLLKEKGLRLKCEYYYYCDAQGNNSTGLQRSSSRGGENFNKWLEKLQNKRSMWTFSLKINKL